MSMAYNYPLGHNSVWPPVPTPRHPSIYPHLDATPIPFDARSYPVQESPSPAPSWATSVPCRMCVLRRKRCRDPSYPCGDCVRLQLECFKSNDPVYKSIIDDPLKRRTVVRALKWWNQSKTRRIGILTLERCLVEYQAIDQGMIMSDACGSCHQSIPTAFDKASARDETTRRCEDDLDVLALFANTPLFPYGAASKYSPIQPVMYSTNEYHNLPFTQPTTPFDTTGSLVAPERPIFPSGDSGETYAYSQQWDTPTMSSSGSQWPDRTSSLGRGPFAKVSAQILGVSPAQFDMGMYL